MAIATNTLMDEGKCYACFGLLSTEQILELALWRRIAIATNPSADVTAQGLLNETACYACLGLSLFDLMLLGLMGTSDSSDIVPGTQEMVLTGDGLMNPITAEVISSTGFWAIEDSSAIVTIYLNGVGATAAGVTSATIWPCLSATDDTNYGSITSVIVAGPQLGGPLDATQLTGLTFLSCSGNQINDLLVGGLTSLTTVEASVNSLGAIEVDAVLVALNASGALNGSVDLTSNTAPGAAGLAAATALGLKGWTVSHD